MRTRIMTMRQIQRHLSLLYTINSVCLIVFSPRTALSTGTTSHPDHTQTQCHQDCTHGDHGHNHNSTDVPSGATTQKEIKVTLPPTMSPLEIKSKLEEYRVVPDVIPVAPEQKLDVWFGVQFAEMGNVIHEDAVAKQPILLMWRFERGEYFTVIATGPDVPDSELPTDAEWRHWIVMNIPGNDVAKGLTVREYVGFANETGFGLHRMVFLVFKQPRPYMKSPELVLRFSASASRGFFSTRNFVRTHGLGNPVAANFVLVNCTNIMHDPVAWAAMTTPTTTQNATTLDASKTPNGTTTQGYEWTAVAEEVTDEQKPKS